MKNKLTKLYRLFSQIVKLSTNNSWDQLGIFMEKYDKGEYIICYQILYELVSENKNIDIRGFNVDLTIQEIRKYAGGVSLLFYPETGEICKTTPRNSSNKPTGKVVINDVSTDETEVLEFVDGINVSSDVVIETIKKSPQLIEWEISYLKDENPYLALEWVRSLGGDIEWLKNLKNLLVSKNVDYYFFQQYLIDTDRLTSEEIKDLNYVEDRINNHLENDGLGNYTEYEINRMQQDDSVEKYPIFRINGEIPESLESIEDCEAFLNYLYDDCVLLGVFHPDDAFENYVDENDIQIFSPVQQEKYTKYIEDMFELDADGDSIFVKAGFEDIYDYCMNYRNDSHNNEFNENKKEAIQKINDFLYEVVNENANVFYVIKCEPVFIIPDLNEDDSLVNGGSPSFIRGELVGNKIYFYEILVSIENNIFTIDKNNNNGVFLYFPETDSFEEFSGNMDERATLTDPEIDGWNCIDFIKNLINENYIPKDDINLVYGGKYTRQDGKISGELFVSDPSPTSGQNAVFHDPEYNIYYGIDGKDLTLKTSPDSDLISEKEGFETLTDDEALNRIKSGKIVNYHDTDDDSKLKDILTVDEFNETISRGFSDSYFYFPEDDLKRETINFQFVTYEEDDYLSVGIRYTGNVQLEGFQADEENEYFKYIQIEKGESEYFPQYNGLVINWLPTGYWHIFSDNGFDETIANESFVDEDNDDISENSNQKHIDWLKKLIEEKENYLDAIETAGSELTEKFYNVKLKNLDVNLKKYCEENNLQYSDAHDLLMKLSLNVNNDEDTEIKNILDIL